MNWFFERCNGRIEGEEPLQWDCFSKRDSERLENAIKSSQKDPVPVGTDELYEVDISSLLMSSVYWRSAPLKVRRAFWFEKPYSNDSWHPTIHSEVLESLYANLSSAEECVEFPLAEKVTVKFDRVNQYKAKTSSGVEFFRGLPEDTQAPPSLIYSEIPNSPEQEQQPKKHLIFIIHGIGQKLFDKRNRPIHIVCDWFREVLRMEVASGTKDEASQRAFQILPIEWRLHLNFLKDQNSGGDFDSIVESIYLPSITTVRHVLTDLSLDVLLYMSPEHYKVIIDYLVAEVNQVYKLFVSKNPSFSGKVSFLGHSLGSVLAYDLISCQFDAPETDSNSSRLDFKVDRFWTFGSPLPMFLLLKGINLSGTRGAFSDHPKSKALKKDRYLDCNEFYNLFHPNDPCAFRLEPLLRPEFQQIPPFKAKNLISRQKQPSTQWKQSFKSMFTKNPNQEDAQKEKEPFSAFNSTGRLDFELSEKMLDYSYFSMFSAHTCYWKDVETGKFIWSSLDNIEEPENIKE